jgi:hypothetical protein
MHTFRLSRYLLVLLLLIPFFGRAFSGPSPALRVIIIRHAEKPVKGKNLSCQGQNRAAALPAVLHSKFGRPDYAYVPAMQNGKKSAHLRMFQTITPFASQYNINVNSRYEVNDYKALAADILQKKGTVLVVWEHDAINNIAKALGVEHPGKWMGDDYDSIWIITIDAGHALLRHDHEGLHPAADCK